MKTPTYGQERKSKESSPKVTEVQRERITGRRYIQYNASRDAREEGDRSTQSPKVAGHERRTPGKEEEEGREERREKEKREEERRNRGAGSKS